MVVYTSERSSPLRRKFKPNLIFKQRRKFWAATLEILTKALNSNKKEFKIKPSFRIFFKNRNLDFKTKVLNSSQN
jgi:hypothetical protein